MVNANERGAYLQDAFHYAVAACRGGMWEGYESTFAGRREGRSNDEFKADACRILRACGYGSRFPCVRGYKGAAKLAGVIQSYAKSVGVDAYTGLALDRKAS